MAKPYALIIESDGSNARTLARQLEEMGYQTQVVSSGHEAQARLSFTNPDLVLLDAGLPSLPAAVILRQIKGQPRLANTRVVLLAEEAAVPGSEDFEVLVRPAAEPDLQARLRLMHLSAVDA